MDSPAATDHGRGKAARRRWPGSLRKTVQAALSLCLVAGALVQAQGRALSAAALARNSASVGQSTIPQPTHLLYLPLLAKAAAPCPTSSDRQYRYVHILGKPTTGPAPENPDLNLAVRGYVATDGTLGLVDLAGPTDADPPQLPGLYNPARLPAFRAVHQVYDWDWGCGEEGCRGQPIASPPVTLLEVAAAPGEVLFPPHRRSAIHEDGYVALVLYAEEHRLTLTYTREDNPAVGYMAHLEDICVDANLLALYARLDKEGRRALPTVQNGDALGTARHDTVKVAVRDTGSFMEPRSRKDWWQGY